MHISGSTKTPFDPNPKINQDCVSTSPDVCSFLINIKIVSCKEIGTCLLLFVRAALMRFKTIQESSEGFPNLCDYIHDFDLSSRIDISGKESNQGYQADL